MSLRRSSELARELAAAVVLPEAGERLPRRLGALLRSFAHLPEQAGEPLPFDAARGRRQVVPEPLGDSVGEAGLPSCAAVRADGREGLVLDVDHSCNQVTSRGFAAGDHGTKEAT
jgi:hypothetical protein